MNIRQNRLQMANAQVGQVCYLPQHEYAVPQCATFLTFPAGIIPALLANAHVGMYATCRCRRIISCWVPPPSLPEAGYLAGAPAGLMTESDIISAIGGMGIPPVVEFIEGYQNGAQCDNSNVVVLVKYTHDWFDPAGGAAIAEDMVADGADVIFPLAGATGNGALLETTQSGEWAIGVDVDQYFTIYENGAVDGSDKLLSSAVKNADNAVFETISDVVSGTFTSGTELYNLKIDGVGLAPFHEADPYIPQSVRDQLASIEQGIINGTINIQNCRGFYFICLPLTLNSDN